MANSLLPFVDSLKSVYQFEPADHRTRRRASDQARGSSQSPEGADGEASWCTVMRVRSAGLPAGAALTRARRGHWSSALSLVVGGAGHIARTGAALGADVVSVSTDQTSPEASAM